MKISHTILETPLPKTVDPVIVGKCEECNAELFDGDEVHKFLGDYFCEEACLLNHIGAKPTTIHKGDSDE